MRKKPKIVMALFLVFSMLLSVSAVSLAQVSDIGGNWAEAQIRDWVEKKLINGYADGSFGPDNQITRAEYSALINRALGFFKKSDFKFNDVSPKDWFAGDISIGKAQGYLYGDGSNAMPKTPISRQEVITILARILKLKPDEATLSKYSDAASIASWAKGSVGAVSKLGYINDYTDNTFKPEQYATRAEVVAILHKAVGTLYNKSGIYELSDSTGRVAGNVTIAKPDMTLKNMVIDGNLYLTEGLGDGSVTLENVTVKGTTTISGGGKHGIVILNSSLGSVTVNVPDNSIVTMTTKGSSCIGPVDVMSALKLEEDALTGKGFGEVLVEIPEGAQVELAGNFEKVNVTSPKAQLSILSGIINELLVNSKESGIALDTSVSITTLTVSQPSTLTGLCVIETAIIHSNDVKIETKPNTVKKDAFLTGVEIGYGVLGGGGGGGGGGSATTPTPTPTFTPTPTPTPTPSPTPTPTPTPSPSPSSSPSSSPTPTPTPTPTLEILTVTGVDSLGDRTVEFGTELELASLPATAQVTLSNGSTEDLPVTWDISSYVPDVAGEYIFSGTLTMPSGPNITNPDNIMASIKVIVNREILTVISVAPFSDITVERGIGIEGYLPTSAQVTLSDETTRGDFTVTWDTSLYDLDRDGLYVLPGTLIPPAASDIIVPNDIRAGINVIVGLSIINVDSIRDINVSLGTDLAAIVLPASINVTLSDGTTRSLSVTSWDTTSYNGGVEATYTFTGILALPADVIDPMNHPAMVNVVVGEHTVTVLSVDIFADKNVPEGTQIGQITLPTQATVNLSDNSSLSMDVIWNTSSYRNITGTCILPGTISIPEGIFNPSNITASFRINVVNPIIDPNPDTPLMTSRGSEIDECDSLTGWTCTDNAVVSLDSGIKASGSASLNISANVAGGPLTNDGYQVMKVFNHPVNMSDMNNVQVDVYIQDITQTDRFSIRFYNDENSAWYENCYMRLISNWKLVNGWNRICLTKDEFMLAGSPSWDSISCVRVIFFPREGCKPSVNLDRIAYNVSGRAQILFTFDDGWYDLVDPSITDNAFSYLSDRGFDATVWAKMSSVDGYRGNNRTMNNGSAYLNETDLEILYEAGWDIGNHTVNHPDNINELTDSQIRYEFEECQQWLINDQSWGRGARFACYPSGIYDEHIIDILQNVGVLAARTVAYGLQTMPVDNMLKLKCIFVDSSNDVEVTKQQIDNAINTGSTIILMLHKIEDSTDPIALSTAEFRQIVDYVYLHRSDLDVTTISEWYEKYMGISRITEIETIDDINTAYGTEFEALGLPSGVEVTLNNGDTEHVPVSWDTGSYDGNTPGPCILSGTLTPPSGITNPLELMARVTVVVTPQSVTGVQAIADIPVPFGTEIGAVDLPLTVAATMNDGSILTLGVLWNTTSYNPNSAGTYALQGTLTLPEGAANPDNIMASANVIVAPELTVAGVPALADIPVAFGTEIVTITLPQTVNATLSDNSIQSLDVTWDITPYNPNMAGTYTLEGTLTLPLGIANPGNISASINVIVREYAATIISVQDATVIEVVYGTGAAAIPLPLTVNAALSDDTTQALNVTWDTSAYNPYVAATYTLQGTLTLPEGVTNPDNIIAFIDVVVEPQETISSMLGIANIPDQRRILSIRILSYAQNANI